MPEEQLLPNDIYAFLSNRTLGQAEVLQKVSVAVYRHINGFRTGNILLIGNSGTGKTTIMNSIQRFYAEYKQLKKYQVMTIMNANMLEGEHPGDVNLNRLINSLEQSVDHTFGKHITEAKVKEYMENATVCIDEVDKISGKISDKVNVSGISIQHALLTMFEGEKILYETTREEYGKKKDMKLTVDTSKMLFICGGAFEGLYDQVYEYVAQERDERRLAVISRTDSAGRVRHEAKLVLKDQIKLNDLFAYGMAPQFISRFRSIGILEDLGPEELKQILLKAEDSPLRDSQQYFRSMGIDLRITKDALNLIADNAVENTRIGARALGEVFTRIIDAFEFDPFGSGKLENVNGAPTLTIDKEVVLRSVN